ncbi:MAG: hypothetical protein DWQ09_13755 [Proteobacteria bacterium]|nr:MAG: hypothetical protein DWQ09_13755 [Pseudomonadota bacterium]QKK10251.1 MAG: hypothetical protein HND59_00140 [Pseudomonadota bacterium]
MRWLVAFSTLFATGAIYAADSDLLPPEQAFVVEAHAADQGTVKARWIIADGYYLYRERISFEIETPGYQLGTPRYPAGKIKEDPFFGRTETYRHQVLIDLPIEHRAAGGATLVLIARSQGCADLGVCYPPQERRVTIELPKQSRWLQPAYRLIAAH